MSSTILPLNHELDFTQMDKLEEMLKTNQIPYERNRRFDGWNIVIPDSGKPRISVLLADGSYGSDRGLLEVWAMKQYDDPEGFLTAEEALCYIAKAIIATLLPLTYKNDYQTRPV